MPINGIESTGSRGQVEQPLETESLSSPLDRYLSTVNICQFRNPEYMQPIIHS